MAEQPEAGTGTASAPATRRAQPEIPKDWLLKPSQLTTQEKMQYDLILHYTQHATWYYRDRMNVPRGPCPLPVLKSCWTQGVIDENTLVWGQGLGDWLPIRNVRTLVPQIRTPEVQFATWVKKKFALQPAIARARRQRAAQRPAEPENSQVEDMF